MADQKSIPTSINGISLYTKAGKLKSRYHDRERLQMLGATEDDLKKFIDLFCPGRPHYSITRAKSNNPKDWTTPRGRLTATDVLNHLLGDLIPNKPPRWVAPRSWEVTLWVGVDVDLRTGDVADFKHRCLQVRHAFRALGVPNEGVRVDRTPSGGKHFRFFLAHKIKVDQIEPVLNAVGIFHQPGRFEIFPSMKRGLRLGFGKIPDETHDATAGIKFIRKFDDGKIPKVNWFTCRRNAINYCSKHPPQLAARPAASKVAATHTQNAARQLSSQPHASKPAGQPHFLVRIPNDIDPVNRYATLFSQERLTSADVDEIWQLGIRLPGTRFQATTILGWHLYFAKGMAAEEVVRQLTKWVYETGKYTSNDVQADLACGSPSAFTCWRPSSTRNSAARSVSRKSSKSSLSIPSRKRLFPSYLHHRCNKLSK